MWDLFFEGLFGILINMLNVSSYFELSILFNFVKLVFLK